MNCKKLQLNGYSISRGTISHWEMGRVYPPFHDPEFTNALADALQLSVIGILVHAGYRVSRDGFSENAKHAAEIIDKMPPKKQAVAINILEQLVNS